MPGVAQLNRCWVTQDAGALGVHPAAHIIQASLGLQASLGFQGSQEGCLKSLWLPGIGAPSKQGWRVNDTEHYS